MLPSDNWAAAQENEEDDNCQAAAVAFWRVAPLDALEDLCQKLSSTGCTEVNREKYRWGQNNLVVEIAFDDGHAWIARLRLPVNVFGNEPDYAAIAVSVEQEVATLKLIRERTTIPVPTIIAYSATRANELGTPYDIMSALPGRWPEQIGLDLSNEPSTEATPLGERYLASIADIQHQLSTIRFDRIGSIGFDPGDASQYAVTSCIDLGLGPFDTASSYYAARARVVEREIATERLDSKTERERLMFVMWLYRLALGAIAARPDDAGPFMLAHNDLHDQNTLVDETGAIVGVLDWDAAGPVPIPMFAADALCGVGMVFPERGSSTSRWHDMYSEHLRKHPQLSWLAEEHSSRAAHLVGRVHKVLNSEMIADSMASGVASLVLGTEECERLRLSPLFREWYASTTKELRAVSEAADRSSAL